MVERHNGKSADVNSTENTPAACPECVEARRNFLKGIASVSVGLLGLGTVDVFASTPPDHKGFPRPGDHLAAEDAKGAVKALTLGDIPENADPLVAYPFDPKTKKVRSDNRFNGVLLLKFPVSELDDQMTKLAAKGVLAYSQVCVHAGCPISTYVEKDKTYFCYCHFSKYYPLQDGKVASGPAPRPLPNLPIKVASDGRTLVVNGPFNAPIGP